MLYGNIRALVEYGLRHGLLEEDDALWARNRLLEIFGEPGYREEPAPEYPSLDALLDALVLEGVRRGVCEEGTAAHDLFDTKLMGVLTARPSETARVFEEKRRTSPEAATDWFYRFCGDVNYVRRGRSAKDIRWVYRSPRFGDIDITINKSKPEKDPKAIAAAKLQAASGYPTCMLCPENIGYAGRLDFPARQNHRAVPLHLRGGRWFLQYSPYVYYNEHCIVFAEHHTPMRICKETFEGLFEFVQSFPHYFLGSNADLPIVGGSILTHDHYQGGRYTFAMARAGIEIPVTVPGFADVEAGVLNWPVSVLRLRSKDPARLCALGVRVHEAWRGYSDPKAEILAETNGEPHNTVTPIARCVEGVFELDLALRNNRTTAEHPLGIFHPHAELHHIKKENIGLIEVMGLAVLPPRLETELDLLADAMVSGADLAAREETAKHAEWAREILSRRAVTAENAGDVLREEVGAVFERVLCDAGVFKCTPEGREAFLRFCGTL